MTIEKSAVPVTALGVLQADGTEIDTMLERADPLAGAKGAFGFVGDALWAATLREVGEAASGFLQIELGDVMVAGWSKYRDLRDAGRRTLGTDTVASVDLAGTNLVLRRHPRVDVTWRGEEVASIPFEVAVDIRVHSVVARVRDGALVELTSGSCDVEVSIETNGVKAGPKTMPLNPRFVVDLGEGFRLAD